MSVPRKIAFTTLGTSGIGKKDKPTPKSLRLEVNLSEPSKEESPEVSYEDLVYNILKKKGNHEKAVSGLDPYASDDEDQLKELAKKFESKYGGPVVGKKKKRRDEFVDKGAGYDDTDPFIDNSEAYDEYIPSNVTTAYGGFYINCGELEFKTVEFSESESSSEESSSEASGSESSSGESESTSEEESIVKEKDGAPKARKRLKVSSSDASDSSRPATPETSSAAEKKKEKVELKKKRMEEVKKPNGTLEKAPKSFKSDSEKPKHVEGAKPKADSGAPSEVHPKKSVSGLDSVFDTIESVVKGRASESESKVLNGKAASHKPQEAKSTPPQKLHEVKTPITATKPPMSSPPGVKLTSQGSKPSLQSAHKPSILKSDTPKPKVGKVAENGSGTPSTKELSVALQKTDVSASAIRVEGTVPPVKKAESQKAPSDESDTESESSSSDSESESEKEHSDADEPTQSQETEVKSTNAKLPEDLPFELQSVINALKEKAEEAKGVKSKFFTEEVNSFLFRIELFSKQLRCGVRQEMYDYLTSFLPCKKLTLLKRARTSLADHIASRKNFYIAKLKTLVERSLPAFFEKFGTDLSDLAPDERTAVFKSFIASQEEARNMLSKIIFLKSHHFNIIRSRKDSPKEAIMLFLESEVSHAFPSDFVSSELLYREMESSHANVTSDKKLTAKEKKMDNLRLLSLLIKPTKPPKTISPVPKSPTKKPRPPQPKPTSLPRPLELTKESKLAPNWEVAKEIELKILAEKEFRCDVDEPVAVEGVIKGPERTKDEISPGRKLEGMKRPRSDSPEVRKMYSEPKRQNVAVSPETYAKPKSASPQIATRIESVVRNSASPEKISPKSSRTLSASPAAESPKARIQGTSPTVERLPTPTGSVAIESYRASVVSVENISERARQPKPKSPKPKIAKPPKEKKEPKQVVPSVVEPVKQAPKPTFELNTESAKAVESLFAFMSPEYSGGDHNMLQSPKEDVPLQEVEDVVEAHEVNTERDSEALELVTGKDMKFESISPPDPPSSPKAEKDQPDLSWVFHEMSQISQKESEKPADSDIHDEKVEDQKLQDSFGKMFELTENVIKGTQNKPKQAEKTQNGNYSESFEKFLSIRSPPDASSELQDLTSTFSSKKHKAMKMHAGAKPQEPPQRTEKPVMQGEKAYLDFLKSHSRDFGASTLASPSEQTQSSTRPREFIPTSSELPSSARPSLSNATSRQGGIPSYPASQYFKHKEPALTSYYQGMDNLQRQRRESDSWGEAARRQESTSPYQRSYSNIASSVESGELPVQLSRSQSQMYSSEAHQNPLNYSRSPAMSSMMSGYVGLPGYGASRGYPGVDELAVQQAMSQAQVTRETLANQLLYEQQKQQQRAAHYKESPRSSHSGSANYHSSHR